MACGKVPAVTKANVRIDPEFCTRCETLHQSLSQVYLAHAHAVSPWNELLHLYKFPFPTGCSPEAASSVKVSQDGFCLLS